MSSSKQPKLSGFFKPQNNHEHQVKKEFRSSWTEKNDQVKNANPAVYNPNRSNSSSKSNNQRTNFSPPLNRFSNFQHNDQNIPQERDNSSTEVAVGDTKPAMKKRRVLPNSIMKSNVQTPYANGFRPNSFVGSVIPSKPAAVVEIPADESLSLSASQKRVLDAIMKGKSVFFTGAAGTGKSFILKILRQIMEELDRAEEITFTAPTGVAACNIRGMTIHSWAGIGRGNEPIEKLVSMVQNNRTACKNWREIKILIIDEISMLSAELFDKLDSIGRYIRGGGKPFGGIQLILCGDFFQLPPVGLGRNSHFAFESNSWQSIFGTFHNFDKNYYHENDLKEIFSGEMILLDKVFRQKDDIIFLELLNDLRYGIVSNRTKQILNNKVLEAQQQQQQQSQQQQQQSQQHQHQQQQIMEKDQKEIEVKATKLFSINRDVDAYNNSELAKIQVSSDPNLPIQQYTYKAYDSGNEPFLTHLKNGTKAPELLNLKVGAQVMLLKNVATSRGLVNGARGTVIRFIKNEGPDADQRFPILPVVKFITTIGATNNNNNEYDDDDGYEILHVTPDSWDIKNGDIIKAMRTQIPLMLAWAISIHKSQGMTIPLLEVSFDGMFEYGQGYVALSRAVSLNGLTLRSFHSNAIKVHQKVKYFYSIISEHNKSMMISSNSTLITTTINKLCEQFELYEHHHENNQNNEDNQNDDDNDDNDEEWINTAPRKALREAIITYHNKNITSSTATTAAAAATAATESTLLLNNERKHSLITSTSKNHINVHNDDWLELNSSSNSIVSNPMIPMKQHEKKELSEEIKQRIERNRLAALEKLAQKRQRDKEQAAQLSMKYGV